MARNIIVVGDPTSSGGRVVTGSPTTDIDGKPVARIGDQAVCPRHKGPFAIVSGDATTIIDGQPVARHGDYLACGCQLLSGQQSHVFVESGGTGASAAAVAKAAPVAAAVAARRVSQALASKKPVCEECLLAAAQSGAAFLGR